MQKYTKYSVNLIALSTIAHKEISRVLRIWLQTLLAPAFTFTLYLIIFGRYIGSRLPPVGGYSYLQYIVPGLILMAIIQNTYSNTASSFFLAKFTNSIEEILVAPVSNMAIILGYICGGVFRGLLVGGIVYAIGCLFTHIPVEHPMLTIFIITITAVVFSLAGLINAIYAKNFDDISFVPTFIILPLTYLGGIFYAVKDLPLLWRNLLVVNPIFNIVDSFRFAMLNITDFHNTYGIWIMSALFLSLFSWSWFLLSCGINVKK